jgi:hypothetical protein
MSLTAAKERITIWLRKEAYQLWNLVQGNRQAKLFLTTHSKKRASEILNMSRTNIRLITELLTGHCHLKKHLHRIGLSASNTFRFCEDEEETPVHILCECDEIARLRLLYLGHAFPKPGDVMANPLRQMVRFIEKTGLANVGL